MSNALNALISDIYKENPPGGSGRMQFVMLVNKSRGDFGRIIGQLGLVLYHLGGVARIEEVFSGTDFSPNASLPTNLHQLVNLMDHLHLAQEAVQSIISTASGQSRSEMEAIVLRKWSSNSA